MALRMERSVANAAAMAEFLRSHPLVKKLNYAGLSTHPGADVHARQATSGGAVLSFETGVWADGHEGSCSKQWWMLQGPQRPAGQTRQAEDQLSSTATWRLSEG